MATQTKENGMTRTDEPTIAHAAAADDLLQLESVTRVPNAPDMSTG